MKPSDTSKSLRKIAAAINASKSPDRRLVARDLKKILASVEFDPNEYYSPGESVEDHFDFLNDVSKVSGSQLLWHAMKQSGTKNWGPAVDAEAVIALAVELSKAKGDNAQQTKYVEEYSRKNWDTFMKSVWPRIQAGEKP